MIFGRKAKPHDPRCDICGAFADAESDFGALCQRCIDRAVYVGAFIAAGKPAPHVTPPPPKLTQPLSPDR